MTFTLVKRLAFFIRKLRPRLRVRIATPHEAIDHMCVNILIPSLNPAINEYLERDQVSGCIEAISADAFNYTDAVTAETTRITLPKIPAAIGPLLQQLGY